MNADGGDVQFTPCGSLIERLDVLKDVFEIVPVRVNEPLGHCVKHKGVVRIGRMAEG